MEWRGEKRRSPILHDWAIQSLVVHSSGGQAPMSCLMDRTRLPNELASLRNDRERR